MATSKALEAAKAVIEEESQNEGLGKVKFRDNEYTVWKRPNALLVAEFAIDGPNQIHGLYKYLEFSLEGDFASFKKDFYAVEWATQEESFEALVEMSNKVVEVVTGRPKA